MRCPGFRRLQWRVEARHPTEVRQKDGTNDYISSLNLDNHGLQGQRLHDVVFVIDDVHLRADRGQGLGPVKA